MDKEEWRSFLRWLDQANVEELRQRKAKLAALRRDLDDRDIKADASRMIRLIDQDLLARSGIAERLKGKRSPDA